MVHPKERFRNGYLLRGYPLLRSVDRILTAQSSFPEGVKTVFRSQYLAEEARVRCGSKCETHPEWMPSALLPNSDIARRGHFAFVPLPDIAAADPKDGPKRSQRAVKQNALASQATRASGDCLPRAPLWRLKKPLPV